MEVVVLTGASGFIAKHVLLQLLGAGHRVRATIRTPARADEVLYKLRAIVLSVRSDGLIRANEEMTAWMRGERSMPFGPNNEHVPVRLR